MFSRKIGRYQIKEEIGRGGMATVYRAFDPNFNREVVVKVLPREMLHNLRFRVRFKRELKTIALLEHPAIVPVYDVGEFDGQPFFVMRYMSGGSLADWIKRGKFSLQDTARIVEKLALGLEYAHNKGIIHRDIKPDNILFDANDNPYLSDFGVAKLADAAVSMSGSGVVGTPAYMSPEQAQNKEVDRRSDVYGMGVIIYHMLTGKQPYEADTPMTLAVQHITQPIPEILKINPDLPEEVDAVIKKAMAKDRNERYSTALELAHALSTAAFGDERTSPISSIMPDKRTAIASSRKRTGAAVSMILLFLAMAGLVFFRGQLPFLAPASTSTLSLTPSPTSLPSTETFTPEPTLTLTLEATTTPEPPTALPPPGGADQIAFFSGNQVHLMNVDGSGVIPVRTDNAPKRNLQWIPGNRLVYISRNCAYLLDAETRESSQIVCFNLNELLEGFRVSPDGSLVAISVQRTLYIVPFDLDELKRVTTRFNLPNLEGSCTYGQFAFRDVIWSRESTRLAALVVDTELSSTDQVFLLDVDIANCQTIGPILLDKLPGDHFDFGSARIQSFDWDGGNRFLLNDYVRNDGFGDLYLYDSSTQEGRKINPVEGSCCYRDARFSPDGKYLLFMYQNRFNNEIKIYYIPFSDLETGQPLEPIQLQGLLLRISREKPQPALRPAP